MSTKRVLKESGFRILSNNEIKSIAGGMDEECDGGCIDVIGNRYNGLTISEVLTLLRNNQGGGNFVNTLEGQGGGAPGDGETDITDLDEDGLLTPEQREAIEESIQTLVTSLEELIAEFGDFDITLGDLRINAKVLADGLGAFGDGLNAGFLINDILNGDAGLADVVVFIAGVGTAAGLAVAFGPAAATLGGAVTILAGVLAAEAVTEALIANFGDDLENGLIELRDQNLAIIEQNRQNIEQLNREASQFTTQTAFFNFLINLANPAPTNPIDFDIDPGNFGPDGPTIPGGHNNFPGGF